jgi:predicted aspartyl protease
MTVMRRVCLGWALATALQAVAGEAELRVLQTGDIGVLLSVEGRLGGQPVRWLVDSGSSHNLVNLSVPARDSTPAQQQVISSAAGRLLATRVDLGTLQLAGEDVEGQTALRLDLGPVLGPMARHVDGVLGLPFLQSRRLQVDLFRRTISFDAAAAPAGGAVVVTRVLGLPVVEVELQGQRIQLLFDTGAAGAVVRLQRGLLARAGVWLAPRLVVAGTPRLQVPVADLPGTALSRALPDPVRGVLGMALLAG